MRFAAGRDFMEKLERAAEVSGVSDAHGRMADILEKALDAFLEKRDPRQREERRARRRTRKQAASSSPPRPDDVENPTSENASARPPEPSRHIPIPVRDRLLERAGHTCEYQSPDGKRCTERTGLTIDHVQPFARGGTHDEGNLRALCPRHNRHHADRCYDARFMRRKVETARSRSGERGL